MTTMIVAPRSLILYFGTEMPDPTWAASQQRVDVVVQPYHPMVEYGGYAESFPRARRWIYANPTTVDPWILERAPDAPPISHHDGVWNLPRLDLSRPAGVAWAVEHLRSTMAAVTQEEAYGIFVDDLDRLAGDPGLALDILAHAQLEGRPAPRWFVNRGFELLDGIENLDAVLLEGLTPRVAARTDVNGTQWVQEMVVPALRRAVQRGACCHSLDYADQPELAPGGPAPDEGVERTLKALVCSAVQAQDRGLTTWQPRIPSNHQKDPPWPS